MIAPVGWILTTSSAWYCPGVTPASRVAASLKARNRRRTERNPASPSYWVGSSLIASPRRTVPLQTEHGNHLPISRLGRHPEGVGAGRRSETRPVVDFATPAMDLVSC